ncbi:MAG: MarR family transcriptional regulator [Marinifilaceae bacterium]|jgi:DNA-binding MarR family transcriptional regulator|nr:MarR family transcriptional regulator [Marinifilaceae bacterium]
MANKNLIIHNPEMTLEQKVIGLIVCTSQEIGLKITRALSVLDISYLQINILHILSKSPEKQLTVNQIKNFLIDESSNLSRALNKLMDRQLIIKERSLSDQRVVHIKITDAGEKMHIDADKLLINTFNLNLNEQELEIMFELLKKI